LPPRQQLRDQEADATSPTVREEAEALVGYQKWEFDPTKQFIRRNAWLQPVRDFLKARAEAGVQDPWKYLTLPGKDALDVGLLYREGLLERHDDGWPTLAICDKKYGSLVVTRIGRPMLGWARKTIENVLFEPDHAITTNFPYEVINLDYCGALFLEMPNWRLHGRVAILRQIMILQRRCAFLLLLTTRDSSNKIKPKARERMAAYLQWNIKYDDQFRCQYEATFESLDPEACLADFERFAQIVVPKVVALYASKCAYELNELFAGSYLRQDQQGQPYRMICQTFELNPIGRSSIDRYRPDPRIPRLLTHPSLSDVLSCVSPQEQELADEARSNFVAGLLARNPLDVSTLLENDDVLNRELATDAESLGNWWKALSP